MTTGPKREIRLYHMALAWDGSASTMFVNGDPCGACGGTCVKAKEHARSVKEAMNGVLVAAECPSQEAADTVMENIIQALRAAQERIKAEKAAEESKGTAQADATKEE